MLVNTRGEVLVLVDVAPIWSCPSLLPLIFAISKYCCWCEFGEVAMGSGATKASPVTVASWITFRGNTSRFLYGELELFFFHI